MRRGNTIGLLVWGALLCGGCSADPLGYPCLTSLQTYVTQASAIDTVDLLLVIDNSPAMADQQAHLLDQLPRLITTLATGQRDAAHGGNFMPPRSLHVGVVTSTMGLGPITGVAGCPAGFGGDDGILRTQCAGMPITREASALGVFEFHSAN